MTIRKYNLNLDVKDQSFAPQIITRQGDSTGTTQLNVSVTDNGSSVAFNGTPQFRALTSISKLVTVDSNNFSNVEPDKGTFTYDIPSQVLVEPGRLYVAYFAITDNDGIESTLGLTIYVQQAADLNPASYGNYVSAIDGVIKSTQDSITDLKQKIAEAQAAWASGNFVSITTDQTISGSKTFTAPINGALATRGATFTDFADVAKNMVLFSGNWGFAGSGELPANGPAGLSDYPYGVIEVVPNHTTDGVIRISNYPSQMLYETTVDNGLLKGWHKIATDADVATINGNLDAVNQSVAVTDLTNAGLTWVNGFSDKDPTGFYFGYQIFTIKGKRYISISGEANFSSSYTAWSDSEVVKFPAGILPSSGSVRIIAGAQSFARSGTLLHYILRNGSLFVTPYINNLVGDSNGSNWLAGVSIIAAL